jgi:ABC-2 type transport system ATP-binding protein
VIEVAGLGKTFRPPGGVRDLLRGRLRGKAHQALSNISFQIAPGEVVAVVGENGAGKTTLLRILAGLLTPTEGRAQVAGADVTTAGPSSAFRRRVALVLADERSFMWSLSGLENLCFFAALHGLNRGAALVRSRALLDRVGLAAASGRRYGEYSRGMRQRLGLARGLLGEPDVLLLDEPTLGLDPVGARDLRRFLRDDILKGRGRTALVGSNDPSEVELIADRVLYLKAGRLEGESPPRELAARLGLVDTPAVPPNPGPTR